MSIFAFIVGCSGSSNELPLTVEGLNLGEQWATGSLIQPIELVNNSAHPIDIRSISTDCSCTSISPAKLTIGGKRREVLTLEVNLLHSNGDDSHGDSRTLQMGLLISDSNGRKKAVSVEGRVRDLFKDLKRDIYCAPIAADDPCIEFELNSIYALGKIEVLCEGFRSQVSSLSSQKFRVQLKPVNEEQIDGESISLPIEIRSTPEGFESSASVKCVVHSRMDRDCSASEEIVYLRSSVANSASETVVLNSVSGAPFDARIVGATLPEFAVSLSPSDSFPGMFLTITFSPIELGVLNSTIDVKVIDRTGEFIIPILVSGTCAE